MDCGTALRVKPVDGSVGIPDGDTFVVKLHPLEPRRQEAVPLHVFAGAGGLGEGFSPALEGAAAEFDVKLSIEMDIDAANTLKLRAFFRHSNGKARDDYYRFLNGELTIDENRVMELRDYLQERLD